MSLLVLALPSGLPGPASSHAWVTSLDGRRVSAHGEAAASLLPPAGRGVEVSAVQEFPWGRFVFFADPDGNKWAVQELPARP